MVLLYSILPVNEGSSKSPNTCDFNAWIARTIHLARAPKIDDVQQRRLLDFALQNLRNLVEQYPYTTVEYDSVRSLAEIVADTSALYPTHQRLVSCLIRRAYFKKCFSEEQANALLALIKNPHYDEPLEPIIEALAAVTSENVSEVLAEKQKAFIRWQDANPQGSVADFLRAVEAFFQAWTRFPSVVETSNDIRETMRAILTPEGLPWEPNGMRSLSRYLGFAIDQYKGTVKRNPKGAYIKNPQKNSSRFILSEGGMIACGYLFIIKTILSDIIKLKLHTNGNEELFSSQLLTVLHLLHAPYYLENRHTSASITTEILLVIHRYCPPKSAEKRCLHQAMARSFQQQ